MSLKLVGDDALRIGIADAPLTDDRSVLPLALVNPWYTWVFMALYVKTRHVY